MRSPLFALCLALATISGLASAQQPIAGEFEQGGYHYSVAPAPDFVLQREIPMQWPVVGGNSELPRWRTWLVDSQIDHRGAKVRYYHDQAYEPIASELVGDAAKFSIQFNPLYQGLVLHTVAVRRDGVWSNRLKPAKISLARREEGFENDLADGQVTALILMEDIRARDLVRVTYSVVGSNPIVASSQTDTFNLGWVDSILDRYVRVIYPPRTALDWKIFNDAPRPKLIESEDRVELRAHAHSVAAIRNEQDYPNWYNPFPRMQVAQRRSWADVVAWALPLYPEPGALPQDLQQRVDEWQAKQN